MTTRSESFEKTLQTARARRKLALMGVCNVTPDSFSDGGEHLSFEAACGRVDALVGEGADFVDIGAESTRPGARPVESAEQLRRMLEVVRYAARKVAVTVDTTSPAVAASCLEVGALAVNDVSCLADPELADVAAKAKAPFILMHARGPQESMRGFSDYDDSAYEDVVQDVVREWKVAAERARGRGVARGDLIMDPGLGFSKNAEQSAELLRHTRDLVRETSADVLIGASRKSFLRIVDAEAPPLERLGASIAAALHAADGGASILRVHDVRATRQAIDLCRVLRRETRP